MAVSSVTTNYTDRKWLLWALWLLAAIIGGVGLYQRLVHGDRAADFSSYVPWGLWVAAYVYFSGLSAGTFLIAAASSVFRVRALEPVYRLSLLIAGITLVMGLLMIGFDLGHLERAFLVFVRPQFHSMMTWMVWLYAAYLVLLFAMLRLSMKKDLTASTGDQAQLRALGIIGIPLVIGFSGGVGALFSTVAAREYWHSSLFPIFFLVGALTSGTAIVTAIVWLLWPSRDDAWKDLMTLLGRIVLSLVIIEFVLEWAEFSIPSWYQIGSTYELIRYVLFGPYWYVFWLIHLLLGVIVPVLLLAGGRSPQTIGMAAALVATTFFAVRLNLVIPGLITPELGGLELAYRDPIGNKLSFAYMPSWFEWQLLIGVVALGVVLWFVGTRMFPLVFPRSSKSREVGS
jgi:molybdopterin-containing oxidoreductase family membrane subunit